MGARIWDSKTGRDCEITYGSVTLRNEYRFFELHRDLEIPRGRIHWLAAALTSRATFRARVPEFLTDWGAAQETRVRGDDYGLAVLAGLVADRKVFGDEKKWRFGICPTPWDLHHEPGSKCFFEIRLILRLDHAGLSGRDLSPLATATGEVGEPFFEAIDAVAEAYPDVAEFLRSVTPRVLPPLPGASTSTG